MRLKTPQAVSNARFKMDGTAHKIILVLKNAKMDLLLESKNAMLDKTQGAKKIV